jgi:phage terminase Nu1 subunit (DNA packaging protein)
MRCNRNQLSEITGMHVRTIDNKVDMEGLPFIRRPGVDGAKEWLYDTIEVITWMTGRVEAANQTDVGKDAKVREQVANAGLKELELLERQKLMVSLDDIVPLFEETISVFKSGVYAMPGRLGQVMAVTDDAAEAQRLIKKEIDELMDELNKAFRAIYTQDEDEPEAGSDE